MLRSPLSMNALSPISPDRLGAEYLRDACSQRTLLPITLSVDGNFTCPSRSPEDSALYVCIQQGVRQSVFSPSFRIAIRRDRTLQNDLCLTDLTIAGNIIVLMPSEPLNMLFISRLD